eukprot:4021002-Pyramimonas_sp.AAC.1
MRRNIRIGDDETEGEERKNIEEEQHNGGGQRRDESMRNGTSRMKRRRMPSRFLASDAGADYLRSEAVSIFTVPANSMLWIPYGHIYSAFFYTSAAKTEKDAPKWAHHVNVSALSLQLSKTVPKEVMQAINAALKDHYSKESQQVWKDRSRVWENFAEKAFAE